MEKKITDTGGWIVVKETEGGLRQIREVGSEGLVATIYASYQRADEARERMFANGVGDVLGVVHVDIGLTRVEAQEKYSGKTPNEIHAEEMREEKS